eukprot:scaffold14859_cov66-Phaeocystis_antarctica.AAC.2
MGIIQKECCPAELCEATAASIAAECRVRSGAAPPIEVHAGDRTQATTPHHASPLTLQPDALERCTKERGRERERG